MKCSLCEDCGWVCERHTDKPWEGTHACACGAAGAPCPVCNAPTTATRRGCRAAAKPTSTKTAGAIELVTPFIDPIELPNGRQLVTLEDAARYIQKLPKATHDLPHWQDAVEHLMRASADSPPRLMFAQMFMLRAMNHGVERVFNSDRKETHWGKRKLKRDQ